MKKNILITGALGYIGTELCKLYSGFSWKYEVVAIDNRFVSERVNELKRRKIKFIQADILNIDEIKSHIQKAEIVHHLAGITDVAYVKKEADKGKVYAILPNGEALRRKRGISLPVLPYLPFERADILPGSTIVVPRKARPLDSLALVETLTPILANLSVTAASIAAISDN